MAGTKGKSGGARPGAGRPPKPKPVPVPVQHAGDRDMLKMLQDVALGIVQASPIQVRAAIAAVQYTHVKRGDGGKKDDAAEKAVKASGGRFASSAPPQLVVNNKGR